MLNLLVHVITAFAVIIASSFGLVYLFPQPWPIILNFFVGIVVGIVWISHFMGDWVISK